MRYTIILSVMLALMLQNAGAQSGETLKVRNYATTQQGPIVDEFMSFLAIPKVPGDTASIRRNAHFIMEMKRKRAMKE